MPPLFALCLWREARGEGVEGMRAVAWVIWNRSRAWDRTIHDVIMGPNQFTSMTVDRNPPNPEPDDIQMAEAAVIVKDILSSADTLDPTKGALYYYNPRTADSPWFTKNIVESPNHPATVTIGNQEFFA